MEQTAIIMESYDCYSGYGGNEALFNGMLVLFMKQQLESYDC